MPKYVYKCRESDFVKHDEKYMPPEIKDFIEEVRTELKEEKECLKGKEYSND